MRSQAGFTLIEIAIVIVILGLLPGGVLKGQELITSARVRSLISQQEGVKAAYFGFLDRYRALPGNYGQATTNIANTTFNGNGLITAAGVAGATENVRHRRGCGAPQYQDRNQVPSDIVAEIDRKIDDGNPVSGMIQFSTYGGGGTGGTAPTRGAAGQCYVGTNWTAPSVTNCGGSSLL